MAQRPIWRGHLRLALVSCPVALFNARHERESLKFHYINPNTGNRVRMVTLDAGSGDELSRSDLVKGFEFEKHRYLLLDDEDFESARTETSAVLKVDKFVPAGSIDPVYFDGSYYMAPDGDAGDDVYGVLRQAFVETGFVALSRVTMARRERAVLITADGRWPGRAQLAGGAGPQPGLRCVRGSWGGRDRSGHGRASQAIDQAAGRHVRSV